MPRAPTLLDVAKIAGVSRATASLVVRGHPAISEATRAKVAAAMADLGYVYNRGAARLRAARSDTIGVLLPNLTNPFFATLLAGVEDRAEAVGLSVLLANCGEDSGRQDQFLTRMREHGVDGLIICPVEATPIAAIERLAASAMPFVQLLRQVPGSHSDFAGVDFAALTFSATQRLVELGHRRVAYISGTMSHSVHRERLAGFQAAMEESGLDPSFVVAIPLSHADGRAAASTLMNRADAPTAILCFNDVVALGLHRGLVDLGIAIGRDVSIVGIDNTAECDLVVPGLASVATQPFRIGSQAADLLLRRLGDAAAPVERRIEESFFVPRSSCGPAPA